MGFGEQYGALLEAIANEADAIAMRYFRTLEMRVERKDDGTAVTQADRAIEEMARAKEYAAYPTPRETAAPWVASGSICWLPKAPSKRP